MGWLTDPEQMCCSETPVKELQLMAELCLIGIEINMTVFVSNAAVRIENID